MSKHINEIFKVFICSVSDLCNIAFREIVHCICFTLLIRRWLFNAGEINRCYTSGLNWIFCTWRLRRGVFNYRAWLVSLGLVLQLYKLLLLHSQLLLLELNEFKHLFLGWHSIPTIATTYSGYHIPLFGLLIHYLLISFNLHLIW